MAGRCPRLAAVARQRDARIAADDDAVRLLRIDPDVVVVPASALDRAKTAAAVDRLQHADLREPDDVFVSGVDRHRRVVPRALAQAARRADALPGLAPVVRSEQASLLGLDQRVDAPRVARRDLHADLAPRALGQAVALEPLPFVSTVARDPQSAARAATGQAPRRPAHLPRSGEQDARIGRVEADVRRSGFLVDVQHLVPGLPAVRRAQHPAVLAGAERAAQHGGEGDVGVLRGGR